jgi:hypothetical protein
MAFAPVLACALCPVCLATYAKLLSLAGVGVAVTEAQHTVVLTAAVGLSVAVSAWRARRAGRWMPLLPTVAGAGLALAGHFVGDLPWLEWSGVALMLAGAWQERRLQVGAWRRAVEG